MKITIYELLGLIKDGKAPDRIKYQKYSWEWTGDDYKTIKFGVEKFLITGQEYTWVTDFLNDEVEIIEEEKEIEKFDPCLGGIMGFDGVTNIFAIYRDEINEIIDEISKLKKEGRKNA